MLSFPNLDPKIVSQMTWRRPKPLLKDFHPSEQTSLFGVGIFHCIWDLILGSGFGKSSITLCVWQGRICRGRKLAYGFLGGKLVEGVFGWAIQFVRGIRWELFSTQINEFPIHPKPSRKGKILLLLLVLPSALSCPHWSDDPLHLARRWIGKVKHKTNLSA